MALDEGTLKSGLMALTTSFPASHSEAGKRWAEAYGEYASAAQSPTGGAPNVSGAVEILGGVLGAAFAAGAAAPAMEAGFIAFWAAPPMAFAGAFPGVITGPPAGLALAPVFAANVSGRKSAADAVAAIAGALHTFTKTAIVTDATVPTPTVGPIQ